MRAELRKDLSKNANHLVARSKVAADIVAMVVDSKIAAVDIAAAVADNKVLAVAAHNRAAENMLAVGDNNNPEQYESEN